MKLEQLYDGRHLPGYYYDHCVLGVAMTHKDEPESSITLHGCICP